MTKLSGGRGAACTILTVGLLVAAGVSPANAASVATGGPAFALTSAPVPAFPVRGAIKAFYDAAGGDGGYLGSAIEAERSVNGGWKQAFEGGTVYVLPGWGGTFAVADDLDTEYIWQGAQAGNLGWPVLAESAVTGGRVQTFQRGRIYFSSLNGAAAVQGAILDYYLQDGGEQGRFGWPTGDEFLAKKGWAQPFENGVAVLGAGGLFLSSSDMFDAYQDAGGAGGRLGKPLADEEAVVGGTRQRFAGGNVYLRNGVPSVTLGGIGAYFDTHGGIAGALGWPVGTEIKVGAGWTQDFEGGTVYASNAGTALVTAPVLASFLTAGGTAGRLGWPRGEAATVAGSTVQQFTGGSLVVPTSGPATSVVGSIGQAYAAAGGAAGPLGLPLDTENSDGRGWLQHFTGGSILASGYGTYPVPAPLEAAYAARGGRGGVLGYPAGAPAIDGAWGVQRFSGGMLYLWDDGTELVVKGAIGGLYQRNGADGWIGWPVADEQQIAGGWFQDFEYGSIYHGANGTIAVKGAIGDYYAYLGYEDSRLGWPVSAERQVNGGWRQDFQGGSIFYSSATGAHFAAGDILKYYDRVGVGSLGWPLSSEYQQAGGWGQDFERGTVLSSGYGTFSVRGDIGQYYFSEGGPSSAVGWPVGEEFWRPWAWAPWGQAFSSGQITVGGDLPPSWHLGAPYEGFFNPLPRTAQGWTPRPW